jgi:hypothetical protein
MRSEGSAAPDAVGRAGSEIWFEEGSQFSGVTQRPATLDRRDRHPVDRRVASNPSGKEVADESGECAADQTSSTAARQFDFGVGMMPTMDLRILKSICRGYQRLDVGRLVPFFAALTLLRIAFVVKFLIAQNFAYKALRFTGDFVFDGFCLGHSHDLLTRMAS